MRRIHLRWYAAKRRVARSRSVIACSDGRVRTASRPSTCGATGPAAHLLRDAPARTSRAPWRRSARPACRRRPRARPRAPARVAAVLASAARDEGRAGLPGSSARTTRLRSFGCTRSAARGSRRRRGSCAAAGAAASVVEALPAGPCARRQLGRPARRPSAPPGTRRPDPPTTTGVLSRRANLVDRRVREPLVLADGALAVERPDADEPHAGVLVRRRSAGRGRPASSRRRPARPGSGLRPPRRRPSCPTRSGRRCRGR